MKKVIGIIGVVVFSTTLFFNMNSIVAKSDINLADLMSFNSANAEVTATDSNGNTAIICDTSTSTCSVTYTSEGVTVTVTHTKNIKHT